MTQVKGYRITGRFTVACPACGRNTTLQYARKHSGQCKTCSEPGTSASRDEQHARYIDCGPAAWDDR